MLFALVAGVAPRLQQTFLFHTYALLSGTDLQNSHVDIGGGLQDNELSQVALAWMLVQAEKAGVKMRAPDYPTTTNASRALAPSPFA